MVIGDKQTLKRCVKRAVRQAGIVETACAFHSGCLELGIAPLFSGLRQGNSEIGQAISLDGDTAAVFAAMDALHLPVQDLERAQQMEQSYERDAWLREVLDAMRTKQALVQIPVHAAQAFVDDRLLPVIVAPKDMFAAGRYGTDYRQAAQMLEEAIKRAQAHHVAIAQYDEQAVRYTLMPLCEDTGCLLHVELNSREQIDGFVQLLDASDGVRALVTAPSCEEYRLIELARNRENLLVRLSDLSHMELAMSRLGTRFVPYASRAAQPELMLGRWILARERIAQALYEAYLPLARAGVSIQSSVIEADAAYLLGGNVVQMCG